MNEKELIENLVYPDTMYRKQIQNLEQQLQSYKQKEDRLIDLLKNTTLENIKCDCNCLRNFVGNIEEILNEGDDKNEIYN